MLQGAGGVGPGTLAARLVEAVPVPVPLVAEPFDEPAGIEVRTTRAILVDGARVREGGPPEAVKGGQGPVRRVLEHRPEEIVRVGGASRETHHRLPFENPGNPHGAGRVRVGRRDAAPGCAGADRDDRARLSADLLRDLHGRPPADPAIGADLRPGDRTLDHAHELAGVLPDGGLQRLLRLSPRRREHGFVVIEGYQVEEEIRHGRVGRAEKRLRASRALLEVEPDDRGTPTGDGRLRDFPDGPGRKPDGRRRDGARPQEFPPAHSLRFPLPESGAAFPLRSHRRLLRVSRCSRRSRFPVDDRRSDSILYAVYTRIFPCRYIKYN